jgi:6-phosphogluconolactonase
LRLIIERDAEHVAARAADWLVARTGAALAARGRATLAFSGGSTPWPIIERFSVQPLPWERIWITQVDERLVGRDDPRRNLRELERILFAHGRLAPSHLLAMPVDSLRQAASESGRSAIIEAHVQRLRELGFDTPDIVQLGLGADGHTASLLPNDPLLESRDATVGLSREHEGVRRLTLTLPALARARELLWIVTGEAKSRRLAELWEGRGDTPAERLPREHAIVICDAAAAQELPEDDDVTA